MARLSKVSLAHIDIPLNHSITFASNSARDAWYDGRTKEDFNNLYYTREEGILLEGVLDDFRDNNFGYYLNESSHRVYFRITDMTYINEKTTRITIEKDVLLTYLPTSTMQPSFIERSNDQPTSLFTNDVPEVQYNGGYAYDLLDIFASPQSHAFFLQIAGSHTPDQQLTTSTKYTPKSFDGAATSPIVFLSQFKCFIDDPGDPFNDALTQFAGTINAYAVAGTGDRIVSAGTIPNADLVYSDTDDGALASYIESVRLTKSVSVSTAINTRIAKDNVTVVIAECDNFANQIEIPISELSGGTLTLVSVSDPISQQRHYGVIGGADGDNELKYRLTINTGTSLPSLNIPYYMAVRNIETDLAAQQKNTLVGGLPSIVGAAATGAAVGGPMGALAGGIAGGLSTATSAIQNKVSANASLEKSKRSTPNVSGNPSGFGVLANRNIGVNIFLKEPDGSGLSQLEDYYRFFGYAKNRIVTPSVKSGKHFYQGNVNGYFPNASATDMAAIRAMFDTGVWLWDTEANFFTY